MLPPANVDPVVALEAKDMDKQDLKERELGCGKGSGGKGRQRI